jgi:hypothetical protein
MAKQLKLFQKGSEVTRIGFIGLRFKERKVGRSCAMRLLRLLSY